MSEKRYVMIALVSEQTIPNIVPVIQNSAKTPNYEEIHFLSSDRFQNRVDWIEAVLVQHKPSLRGKITPHKGAVKSDREISTINYATQLFADLRNRFGEDLVIVCNTTGGTKQMSAGLREAARGQKNVFTVYSDENFIIDNDLVYDDGTSDGKVKIDVSLTVGQYLQAYGVQVYSENPTTQNHIEIGEYIFNVLQEAFNGSSEHISLISYHAGAVILNPALKRPLEVAEFLKNKGLISNFQKMPSTTGSIVVKLFEAKSKSLTGDWLEYFVFNRLRQKYDTESNGLSSTFISQGTKIKWPKRDNENEMTEGKQLGVDNELDVFLMRNSILTVISCKSGGLFRKKDNKKSSKKDIEKYKKMESKNEPIYELETLVRSMGTFGKKVLVIAQQRSQLAPGIIARAKTFGIRLIAWEELPNVAEEILKRDPA